MFERNSAIYSSFKRAYYLMIPLFGALNHYISCWVSFQLHSDTIRLLVYFSNSLTMFLQLEHVHASGYAPLHLTISAQSSTGSTASTSTTASAWIPQEDSSRCCFGQTYLDYEQPRNVQAPKNLSRLHHHISPVKNKQLEWISMNWLIWCNCKLL